MRPKLTPLIIESSPLSAAPQRPVPVRSSSLPGPQATAPAPALAAERRPSAERSASTLSVRRHRSPSSAQGDSTARLSARSAEPSPASAQRLQATLAVPTVALTPPERSSSLSSTTSSSRLASVVSSTSAQDERGRTARASQRMRRVKHKSGSRASLSSIVGAAATMRRSNGATSDPSPPGHTQERPVAQEPITERPPPRAPFSRYSAYTLESVRELERSGVSSDWIDLDDSLGSNDVEQLVLADSRSASVDKQKKRRSVRRLSTCLQRANDRRWVFTEVFSPCERSFERLSAAGGGAQRDEMDEGEWEMVQTPSQLTRRSPRKLQRRLRRKKM